MTEQTGKPAGGARRFVPGIVLGLVAGAAIVMAMGRGSLAPAPSRVATMYSGAGMMTTGKQHLAGSYTVTWSAADAGGAAVGCYHGAFLKPGYTMLTNVNVPGGKVASGTTNVYDLADGDYYIEASSGCGDWSFTFTPS